MRRTHTIQLDHPGDGLHYHHCAQCDTVTNCGSTMCAPLDVHRMARCEECGCKTPGAVSWTTERPEAMLLIDEMTKRVSSLLGAGRDWKIP